MKPHAPVDAVGLREMHRAAVAISHRVRGAVFAEPRWLRFLGVCHALCTIAQRQGISSADVIARVASCYEQLERAKERTATTTRPTDDV